MMIMRSCRMEVTEYLYYQCIHDYNIYHTTTDTVWLLLEIMNVYYVITNKDNNHRLLFFLFINTVRRKREIRKEGNNNNSSSNNSLLPSDQLINQPIMP